MRNTVFAHLCFVSFQSAFSTALKVREHPWHIRPPASPTLFVFRSAATWENPPRATEGVFPIVCAHHKPSMVGEFVVMPKK